MSALLAADTTAILGHILIDVLVAYGGHHLRSVRGDSFTTHPSGEIQNAGAKCSFTTTYSVCLFLSIKNRPPTKRLTT